MFVSSYSTYIDTNTTRETQSKKTAQKSYSSVAFDSKILNANTEELLLSKKAPINYISNYKSLYNRQKLEHKELTQTPTKTNFTKISAMSSAQVAYSENTKMFSLIQKPKLSIDQTPKINEALPLKEQESVLKVKMVNAYIANDNYYRITAA